MSFRFLVQEIKRLRNEIRSLVTNAAVFFAAIFLLFLLLEFVVFRFILIASDYPVTEHINGVVRYRPSQAGVYRVQSEIEAPFRINARGWNSRHQEYPREKAPGEYRIAVIGDSYVAALQLPYDQSLAEQLESALGDGHYRVFRFGIDGAPLSQYLHMLRKEVLQYAPDLLIVNLVHNDFYESWGFKPGVYTSSFLKLKLAGDRVTGELDPVPYAAPWYNWIRESATWRYLAYRRQIRFGLLRELLLGSTRSGAEYRANIDLAAVERNAKNNRIATDYLFRNLKEICDANGMGLLLVIDGDRAGIYEEAETGRLPDDEVLRINRMASEIADNHGIELVDLHGVFKSDYAENGQPFEFVHDGHWNAYAHALVAEHLARVIRD